MSQSTKSVEQSSSRLRGEDVSIRFFSGTIEVRGLLRSSPAVQATCVWDERSACFRAPACAYRELVQNLKLAQVDYRDEVRKYDGLDLDLRVRRRARPYQEAALHAWNDAKARGCVVLPTGSGKSHLALMAIELTQRPTLVVAPTLDLVRQWFDLLRTSFGHLIGVIGGGEYSLRSLTVTTYDSAYIHMHNIGSAFGLIVFDECHHLPGETYSLAAQSAIAPFRLGLTATPERSDGRESLLDALIGPTVFRRDIVDLKGKYLSEYETVRIVLELGDDERSAYQRARKTYRDFVARHRISMDQKKGWSEFIIRASQSDEGLEAMSAHRLQRQLAFSARAKLECIESLLQQHAHDRMILFTENNISTYEISRRFLLPAITHQTKVSERSDILEKFRKGRYSAIVAAKVLNEGVDIPQANVAVVVSGSSSVREHVQRLGRVLRKMNGKQAILYELVSADTVETYTSNQRRDHSAYR